MPTLSKIYLKPLRSVLAVAEPYGACAVDMTESMVETEGGCHLHFAHIATSCQDRLQATGTACIVSVVLTSQDGVKVFTLDWQAPAMVLRAAVAASRGLVRTRCSRTHAQVWVWVLSEREASSTVAAGGEGICRYDSGGRNWFERWLEFVVMRCRRQTSALSSYLQSSSKVGSPLPDWRSLSDLWRKCEVSLGVQEVSSALVVNGKNVLFLTKREDNQVDGSLL